ncbi:hypothetical protein AVEN_178906-1, partial [Araneus ventricosus]
HDFGSGGLTHSRICTIRVLTHKTELYSPRTNSQPRLTARHERPQRRGDQGKVLAEKQLNKRNSNQAAVKRDENP